MSRKFAILTIPLILSASIMVGCGNSQKKQAQAAAEQARLEARQAWLAKQAETEKIENQKKRERAEYIKAVGVRNIQKINSLKINPNFLSSRIYVNMMGVWSDFMPATQWVGLLLENKKISSVEAFSSRGYPGVFVKRLGRPGVGVVFRLEGKDAYPYAIISNDQINIIRSQGDNAAAAIALAQLTNEDALD